MRYASGSDPERALLECHLASVRLRVAVASIEWKRRGNENVFRDPGTADPGREPDWKSAEICVVPKYYHDVPLQSWLSACRAAKDRQSRLVIDISDYPFEKRQPVPAFYSEVLNTCDAVVVNSERMAEMITPHASRRPIVIGDAILGAMRDAGFAPGERLELLWFGHPTNLAYLEARLEGLARLARQRRCRLTVVTENSRRAQDWTGAIPARFHFSFETRFVPWSPEAQRAALLDCDLVLIPSDPADPRKTGASANRIAEALNAGRFPVASPLPSYLPFAEAAWLGPELVQGIEWALANRSEVLARIRHGQAMVAERFATETVGRRWGELFENLSGPGHP